MEALKQFPEPPDFPRIRYGKQVVLLGSCFSSNLHTYFRAAGFSVLSNPFGTVFHPEPLARFIRESLEGTAQERLLQRDDVWLSRDAGSEVYALSETALKEKLPGLRKQFCAALEQAEVLVVTFGSAHGYTLSSSGEIVANCHKLPKDAFQKELTDVAALRRSWEKILVLLKERFPQLKVVFTVSPVRYSRDGWEENNRSKARLFLLTEALCTSREAYYFPAYELVNDVLRDYRYFEADGVHPNDQAIAVVWKLLQRWCMDAATRAVVEEAESLRKMEGHRLLFPESVKSQEFLETLNEKRARFLSEHPDVVW
jgi:hypothetical protein